MLNDVEPPPITPYTLNKQDNKNEGVTSDL